MNSACYFKGDFGPRVVELAKKEDAACLALKSFARQRWPGRDGDKYERYGSRCWYEPITDEQEAELSLRFTLSQPVTSAIPPADLSFLPQAIEQAIAFEPINDKEITQLKALATRLTPIFPVA